MPPHATIEKWWKGYRCNTDDLVSLNMNGRYPVRLQAPLEAAGSLLSAAIMGNGYRVGMGPTGSYNCRKIGGSNTWSLHAYAVAVDWDYGQNPYLRGTTVSPGFGTDPRFQLTEAQIDAVENIRNEDGTRIWRWLGWTIGDTMHFQVDVPPDKCQPATDQEDDVLFQEGQEYDEYEEVSWLLFRAAGGTINVNQSAAHQLLPLLGKDNPRRVTVQDFDTIADLEGMSQRNRERLHTDGLYSLGKELAALRGLAYG